MATQWLPALHHPSLLHPPHHQTFSPRPSHTYSSMEQGVGSIPGRSIPLAGVHPLLPGRKDGPLRDRPVPPHLLVPARSPASEKAGTSSSQTHGRSRRRPRPSRREAESMSALGTGITGGEPLIVLDRVVDARPASRSTSVRSTRSTSTPASPPMRHAPAAAGAGRRDPAPSPARGLARRSSILTTPRSAVLARETGFAIGIFSLEKIVPNFRKRHKFYSLFYSIIY